MDATQLCDRVNIAGDTAYIFGMMQVVRKEGLEPSWTAPPDPKSHERHPCKLMTKVAPSCTFIDSKGDRVSRISH